MFSGTKYKNISKLIITILILNSILSIPQVNGSPLIEQNHFEFALSKNDSFEFIIPNIDTSLMGLLFIVHVSENNIGISDQEILGKLYFNISNCTNGGHRRNEWFFLFNSNIFNQKSVDFNVNVFSSYNGILEIRITIWYLESFYSEDINVQHGINHRINLDYGHRGTYDPEWSDSDNWIGANGNLTLWIRNTHDISLTLKIDSLEINDSLLDNQSWQPTIIFIEKGELISIPVIFPDLSLFNVSKMMGGWLYLTVNNSEYQNASGVIQVFDLIFDAGIRLIGGNNSGGFEQFVNDLMITVVVNIIYYIFVIIVIIVIYRNLRKNKPQKF